MQVLIIKMIKFIRINIFHYFDNYISVYTVQNCLQLEIVSSFFSQTKQKRQDLTESFDRVRQGHGRVKAGETT